MFSWTYARQVWRRLLILLGLHPSLPAPFPLTGNMVDRFPPARWFNYGWHYAMFAGSLTALGIALFTRNIRLLNLLAIPCALIALYSLVHTITRYQIPIFSALSTPGGVGAAAIVAWLGRSVGVAGRPPANHLSQRAAQ